MKSKLSLLLVVTAVAIVAVSFGLKQPESIGAPVKKTTAMSYLGDAQTGDPGLKSIGNISFGPEGLLLVAEPQAASVVAIDTRDTDATESLPKKIEKIDEVIAAGLGTQKGGVQIVDIAVNPASGRLYLSVRRPADKQVAILTIGGDGKVRILDMSKLSYARVTLPGGENSKVSNITDVKFAGDRVLAAGQCSEEFASKIYSLPVPLVHGSSANIFSAETYHVAHRKWETRAPIQSFVPIEQKGEQYVVGSFSCTPIAKFPLSNLDSGAKVKGISVVELGSGNRPLDMFTYKSDGQEWLICHTDRFHWERNGGFGPSRLWGVRVNLAYLNAENVNEQAARRDIKTKSGPEGIEIVDGLFGATHVDKLNDKEMVVLREADDHLNLEVTALPK